MSEFISRYWWLLLVGLALVLLLMRSRGAGSLTQIGGQDVSFAASLAAQENATENQRRQGLIDTLLNYDLTRTSLAIGERQSDLNRIAQREIAEISANTQIEVSRNAGAQALSLANAQYAAQLQQANIQAALQQQAIRAQSSANSRSAWQNILSQGLGTLMPILYDVFDTDFGGWGNLPTAPTFPRTSGGGGWAISIGF